VEKRAARSRAVPEQLFRALADRTRLRLLNLMGKHEICVCYFVEVIGTNQPKISRHLAYLRRAGVVTARRSGKWMHYRIAVPTDARAAFILRTTLDWVSQDPQMQRDRQRLTRASCAPQSFVRLQAAPLPSPVAKSELMAAARDLERNA
jgi:ArsR family transcriptional regulator